MVFHAGFVIVTVIFRRGFSAVVFTGSSHKDFSAVLVGLDCPDVTFTIMCELYWIGSEYY